MISELAVKSSLSAGYVVLVCSNNSSDNHAWNFSWKSATHQEFKLDQPPIDNEKVRSKGNDQVKCHSCHQNEIDDAQNLEDRNSFFKSSCTENNQDNLHEDHLERCPEDHQCEVRNCISDLQGIFPENFLKKSENCNCIDNPQDRCPENSHQIYGEYEDCQGRPCNKNLQGDYSKSQDSSEADLHLDNEDNEEDCHNNLQEDAWDDRPQGGSTEGLHYSIDSLDYLEISVFIYLAMSMSLVELLLKQLAFVTNTINKLHHPQIPTGKKSLEGNFAFGSILLLMFQFMVRPTTAQVGVQPVGQAVAALGGSTQFTCFSSFEIERVEWLINGTSLSDLQLSGVTQKHLVTLQFRNVPAEYNNTRIQSMANEVLSSENSTLLVQGLLSAVGSLMVDARVDHIYVNWTAPFTLDISFSSVDITYCVEVVSSTSSATLHSECGITETEFIYPLPPRSGCHEYNFIVTPVNLVGNGTTRNMHYNQTLSGPELVGVNTTNTSVLFLMSAPVCKAELIFVDVDAGTVYTTRDNDLTIAKENVTFNSQILTPNREYRVILSASNVNDFFRSVTMISTHDIINLSTRQDGYDITVVANFTEHSEATGALLNFIFVNEDGVTTDFMKSRILTANKTSVSQGLIVPPDMLYSGQYMLNAYDIESDKKIMDGLQYQAGNSSLELINGRVTTPSHQSLDCNVTSNALVITVSCPSLLMEFQVIAQLSALNNANILYVNTSMDLQALATLQVPENGEYLVTVLPMENGMGVLTGVVFSQMHTVTDVQFTQETGLPPITIGPRIGIVTIGVMVPVVVFVVTVVVILVVLVALKSRQRKKIAELSPNMYISHRGRTSSITMRSSRSGPPSNAATHDEELAYAIVHDIHPQMRASLPARAHFRTGLAATTTQDKHSTGLLTSTLQPLSFTSQSEVSTYSNPATPPLTSSYHEELSHPPPSYEDVILPLPPVPPSYQETTSTLIPENPMYSTVDLSMKKKNRLVSKFAGSSLPFTLSNEEMTQGEVDSSSSEHNCDSPLLEESCALAAGTPPSSYENVMPHSSDLPSSASPQLPPYPTPLSAERQNDPSAGDHYVAVDPSKAAVGEDVIDVHSIEYACPVGYRNRQKQYYPFVDLSKSSGDKGQILEFNREINNEVVYSEVLQEKESKAAPKNPVQKLQPMNKDEESSIPTITTNPVQEQTIEKSTNALDPVQEQQRQQKDKRNIVLHDDNNYDNDDTAPLLEPVNYHSRGIRSFLFVYYNKH